MNTSLSCIPCLLQQALNAARFVTDDKVAHERIIRDVLATSSGLDFATPPPAVAREIHRCIRSATDNPDPYAESKRQSNRMALELIQELSKRVRIADDPLETAIRLSIAGNVIDFGVFDTVERGDLRRAVQNVITERLYGDIEAFRIALQAADSVLFIADNAGEIVIDRLLIEQIGFSRITVAVRGGPVINDATREDADTAALSKIVKIIDTGQDSPGVIIDEAGDEFRKIFSASDLIIAKGQGNYEGLSDVEAPVFFLLKVKCGVISSRTGLPVGSNVIIDNRERLKGVRV